MSDKEYVILVDENDKEIGIKEKMEAHLHPELHRAFSVFIFNENDELMLQQRALSKYHSPGLWTNTCCSHPRQGEKTNDAAHRRMMEEMGFDCDFEKAFHFTYRADVGDGLIEHEFDHVFIGRSEAKPTINPDEVHDWKYMGMEEIKKDMQKNPGNYTVWFRIAFEEVDHYLKTNFVNRKID
ncbi:MAG: isopentenyl-diphosphate Delta-isomerase [Bacteroidales bacterium]|nr:isopentenyl-diphosphate Delta-isomerase [Bacteroidales bacterium]MCF8402931.1 isopentenyl-diphosphate Delta-isomerase [Bacteroidales bacterium]